ncbi:general secretion pathway protein GspC [Aphanothece sacrum FPU1]|uniref:General secretion pathway protein GspC n=2 Tax=Aphanothece sacrum TaxID=1122 RepID=A0A401IND8_APHSA|nr:general secretion pathway protein GspC [Aphanothece sacrum FPU1]
MYPPNQTSVSPVTPVTPPPKPSPINRIPPPPPLPSTVSIPAKVPVLTPGQIVLPIPPQTAANSLPTANPSHTLVGLLESGSQSTALFTFNGMTRRFAVGESIGGTGWVLMAVQNQTVVISNNGKTRYLEVGQGF